MVDELVVLLGGGIRFDVEHALFDRWYQCLLSTDRCRI